MSSSYVFGYSLTKYLNAVLLKIHLQNKKNPSKYLNVMKKSHFKYGFFMLVMTCFRAYETAGIRTFIERKLVTH